MHLSFVLGHSLAPGINQNPFISRLNTGVLVLEIFRVVVFRRDRPGAHGILIAPGKPLLNAQALIYEQVCIGQVLALRDADDDPAGSIEVAPFVIDGGGVEVGGIVVEPAALMNCGSITILPLRSTKP